MLVKFGTRARVSHNKYYPTCWYGGGPRAAAAVVNMAYTVKAMPSERLRQLVADDYCQGHRHAVGGRV
jgi:hypothetical protein